MPRTAYRNAHQNADRRLPEPPKDNPYTSVPAGRYALYNTAESRWYFFKVDNPSSGNWKGWTFLRQINGENLSKVTGPKFHQVLTHILANPLGAAKDYGKQTAHCGVCGIQLTDPDSIERGIGPICAQKY